MSVKKQSIRVGKRGEIVIPNYFREILGLKYGSNLIVSLQKESLELVPKNFDNFASKWKGKSNLKNTLKNNKEEDKSELKRESFLEKILKK
jgi:AbrB family looped-hinge helix DNA binding protein